METNRKPSRRAGALAVILAWCACGVAAAQVAPGPLSSAHQQLDSITKCGSCHEFGTGSRGFKCLECHAEIRRRVDAKAGFHGRNYRPADGESDCRRCHQEHKGRATPLIRLERPKFDHVAQTGFELKGKHRQQPCAGCHTPAKIPAAAKAEIKLKDPGRSFLGLRRDCLSCHKDQHQTQLGTDCLRCHDFNGFKPASGFNHTTARFQLTGMHQKQSCQKCHGPKPGQEAAQFKGLPFNGCQNCHEDPHHGAFREAGFAGACDNCHNTGGWKNNRPGTQFAHTGAKFRLVGKHAELACAKCHKTADFHRPIPHERCRDCHADPHNGQFDKRAAGSDCSACHVETGFKPARFDRDSHRQSAFPLEGKHLAVPCSGCHQPEGKSAVFLSRKLACPDCHADRHGGEFASAPHRNRCGECHTVAGFETPTFTVERHSETQFPLAGRHASVACEKCHKPLAAPAPIALALDPVRKPSAARIPRNYHFPSRACNACHADPHQVKLACETCHAPEAWKETRPFDHAGATRFPLADNHRKAKCAQCHQPAEPAAAPRFGGTSMLCLGCHRAKDPHAGQFLEAPVEDCSACHVTAQWQGKDFSHDRARFVLNRVHRDVACEKCHKNQRQVAGKTVRVFRGTTAECVQCH